MLNSIAGAARIISFAAALLIFAGTLARIHADDHRPFRMGFTTWPADMTADGVSTALTFGAEHGDIVSVMMIGGIPWSEAYEGKEFSQNVRDTLGYRLPSGKKLFVSISPLDMGRSGMAPYWGEHDNMPLPDAWKGLEFDDPKVLKAYLAFAGRVVETMHPDYLAIGVESNVLLSKNAARWERLKVLNQATYTALKAKYPKLPIFFTTDMGHYLNFAADSKGTDQRAQVALMMRYSDLFAMSFYPYGNIPFDDAVKPGFLDVALSFQVLRHSWGHPVPIRT